MRRSSSEIETVQMLLKSLTAALAVTALLEPFTAAQQEYQILTNAIVPDGLPIYKLDIHNFTQFVTTHDLILGEFTVPWCIHSRVFLPELVEAAKTLDETRNIKMFQMDCSIEKELCSQLKIDHYPSFRVFKNHRLFKVNEFNGQKTRDAIVDYMLYEVLNPVKLVSSDEELAHMLDIEKMEQPTVVNYGNMTDEFNATFRDVANRMADSFTFVSYPSYFNANDTKYNNQIVMYLPKLNDSVVLSIQNNENMTSPIVYQNTESNDAADFKAWLRFYSFPYFNDATYKNFRSYMSSEVPLGLFFYTSPKEFVDYKDFFVELGKKYRGKIILLGLSSKMFGHHTKLLNLREQFPLFAIHDMTTNLKYSLPQLSAEEWEHIEDYQYLDRDAVAKLVDDFVNGVAVPHVKSEEIPEEQEGNVVKLVAYNHDEMVHQKDKDVIVRYYAPWCEHSKALLPIFIELADLFASNPDTRDKIMFADVNSIDNDIVSFPVTNYPTIALYPAGSEGLPIVFDGSKTRDEILAFIKEKGTFHLDGQALLAGEHSVVAQEEPQEEKTPEEETASPEVSEEEPEQESQEHEPEQKNEEEDEQVAHDEL